MNKGNRGIGGPSPGTEDLSARRARFAKFEHRTRWIGLILLVLSVALVGQLFYLQIEQVLHYRTLSDENRVTVRPVPAPRGLIYDRDGTLLVQNEPSFALELNPERVEEQERLLDRLGRALPVAASRREAIEKRIRESPPYQPVTLLEGLSSDQVAIIAARRHRFPAIRIQAQSRRHYRHGSTTAHILGYLGEPSLADFRRFDPDRYTPGARIGQIGLERQYEEALQGRPGHREVETDAFGRAVRTLDKEAPEPGMNLVLTVDLELQKLVSRALSDYTEASAVVLNVRTGGLLAMASQPSFNPNRFIGGMTSRDWQELREAPHEPLINRAVQGEYPPASTVKPILALAGLGEGTVTPESTLQCDGTFQVGREDHTFHCWKERGHGELNLSQAVVQSCDVFFYRLGHKMGIGPIHRAYDQFGLGRETGIDLPREAEGLNPGPDWKRRRNGETWFPGETVMTSIGQGYMQVTPIQLGMAAAAIANGGFRVTPHLVRAVQEPESGDLRHRQLEQEPLPLAQDGNLALVRGAMRRVVSSIRGTAHRLAGGSIPFAGKTGTAQVVAIDREEEELDPEEKDRRVRDHALFIAYAPVQDPRIAVAVVIEHGISGATAAGTTARRIIDGYFQKRGG